MIKINLVKLFHEVFIFIMIERFVYT
ncbi:MAG: hypothetical protein RL308_2411, partial [Bacteroidota bacterium]